MGGLQFGWFAIRWLAISNTGVVLSVRVECGALYSCRMWMLLKKDRRTDFVESEPIRGDQETRGSGDVNPAGRRALLCPHSCRHRFPHHFVLLFQRLLPGGSCLLPLRLCDSATHQIPPPRQSPGSSVRATHATRIEPLRSVSCHTS